MFGQETLRSGFFRLSHVTLFSSGHAGERLVPLVLFKDQIQAKSRLFDESDHHGDDLQRRMLSGNNKRLDLS